MISSLELLVVWSLAEDLKGYKRNEVAFEFNLRHVDSLLNLGICERLRDTVEE